jgi:hypothetical protein
MRDLTARLERLEERMSGRERPDPAWEALSPADQSRIAAAGNAAGLAKALELQAAGVDLSLRPSAPLRGRFSTRVGRHRHDHVKWEPHPDVAAAMAKAMEAEAARHPDTPPTV